MSSKGGFEYTGLRGVQLSNSAAIRLGTLADVSGTVSIPNDDESGRAWKFPAKSGTMPIMGTFAVQIPQAVAAFFSTAVTVSGIRAEDAVIAGLTTPASIGYDFDNGTSYILTAVKPTNGGMTLFFQNLGNATAYIELVGSYVAMR